MIVGIGVDVVDIGRFARSLERTPKLIERLFAESERTKPVSSLAARFAAKEALIKAAGDSTGFQWHDMVVVNDTVGKPSFVITGQVQAAMDRLGVTSVHLSISHDAGIASAFVIAEGPGV